jgi:CubicO group peptidase (beta-lactamase class C family)
MKIKWFIVALGLAFLFSCAHKTPRPEYWPTEDWKTSTPEAQGVDSALLAAAIEPLITDPAANLHSLILIRNGYVIVEWYAPGHDSGTLHNLHSATKSFTATLIGTAVRQKLLSVDQKVLSFFPGEAFDNPGKWKDSMTIQDLLTMGSGLDWAENFYDSSRSNPMAECYLTDDWARYILSRKVITKPGTIFNYNSGCSHLLAVILSKVTGQPVQDYARDNLFEPLGIRDYVWFEDPQGIPTGGAGLQLRPRDIAKLGLLYLSGGVWEGKQILSEKWIQKATVNQYPSGDTGYGYQFRVYPYSYTAYGYGEQIITVLPHWNTILVTTAATDYNLRLQYEKAWTSFWEGANSAMVSRSKPLPENPDAGKRLTDMLTEHSKEKALTIEIPPALNTLTGRTIYFNKNQGNLTSLTIQELGETGVRFSVTALDPRDGTEKEAVYETGMDHLYKDNGYRGYPLSVEYFNSYLHWHYPDIAILPVYLRGSCGDDGSLQLEGMAPGSVIRFRLVITMTDEGPLVRLGQGVSILYDLSASRVPPVQERQSGGD